MRTVESSDQIRSLVAGGCRSGRTTGLVPTMGFLHEGHLSLIRRARRENDLLVVTIFVNPTQFGPNEDLESYPRDLDRDLSLLEAERVDVVFVPRVEELYPPGYCTYVNVEGPLTEGLCGGSRPGHFRGVATIVAKLFNLVSPDRAYFGEKDAQQLAVIRRMARDLDFGPHIVACPTVREADGLAMSSRNSYLSRAERAQAGTIYRSLQEARQAVESGERRPEVLIERIRQKLDGMTGAVIDYVSVVAADSLQAQPVLEGPVLIAVAVKLGGTRLIDNIRVEAV